MMSFPSRKNSNVLPLKLILSKMILISHFLRKTSLSFLTKISNFTNISNAVSMGELIDSQEIET